MPVQACRVHWKHQNDVTKASVIVNSVSVRSGSRLDGVSVSVVDFSL
jgi:hypothetical protein